jgi:ATP-dependent exoDNAse (exonuclease V) beta subunit
MQKKDVVLLARTNAVIKALEIWLLSKKVKMRYFNILEDDELEIIANRDSLPVKLKNRLKKILPAFPGTAEEMVNFIRENQDSKSFVTSIHKSKGREYPVCVIVNSISPAIIEKNDLVLDDKELKKISFDPEDYNDRESKNIHYVAVTRPMDELYYMVVDEETLL